MDPHASRTPSTARILVTRWLICAIVAVIYPGCATRQSALPLFSEPPRTIIKSTDAATHSPSGLISDEDIVRRVKEHDPESIAARLDAAAQDATRRYAGVRQNPSLFWNREHLLDSPSEREDQLSIELPIDLSTRRKLRTDLAAIAVANANAQSARTQSQAVTRALGVYYQLVAARALQKIHRRAFERLQEVARVVRRRKTEGQVAGYEQTRIELEGELAMSRLSETQAQVVVLRSQLALILGIDEDFRVADDALNSNPSIAASPQDKLSTRSLRLLGNAAQIAKSSNTSAAWLWLPPLSITAGLRRSYSDQTQYGYVAGVAVDLPVFDTAQHLHWQARASLGQTQARLKLASQEAQLQFARAYRIWTSTRKELARFDAGTSSRIRALERAVEAGYREGHRSIIELLDARRTRTSIETRRMELRLLFKMAEVELRAARGEFE